MPEQPGLPQRLGRRAEPHDRVRALLGAADDRPDEFWNAGIARWRPSVSAHPGCIACTTTPRPRSRSASISVITTSSRLVRAYSFFGLYGVWSDSQSPSLGSDCVYMPPELTLMTRPGSKSTVSASGARTCVANINSCPSTERLRSLGITPALFDEHVEPGSRAANARTTRRLLRSHAEAGRPRRARRPHPSNRLLGTSGISGERVDGGAQPREAARRREPEPRRRPGDEHRRAVDPRRVRRPPGQSPPRQQAGPPVPEHDAPIECCV